MSSFVWKYFKLSTPQYAQCNLCSKEIVRSNGGTSGMRNHLRFHKITVETQIETEATEGDLAKGREGIEDLAKCKDKQIHLANTKKAGKLLVVFTNRS